ESSSSGVLEVEQRVGQLVARRLQFIPFAIRQGGVQVTTQPLQFGFVLRRRRGRQSLRLLQQRLRLHRLAVPVAARPRRKLRQRRRSSSGRRGGINGLVVAVLILLVLFVFPPQPLEPLDGRRPLVLVERRHRVLDRHLFVQPRRPLPRADPQHAVE